MKIEIYRLDKTLPLPEYKTSGSFAFDFFIRETTEINPKQTVLLPGNIIVKCPPNLALLVLPRSSAFKKTGLIFPHSVGLIDADYHGEKDEIKIQVYNPTDKIVVINKGDRIAQGLFVKTEKIEFTEDHSPTEISRGGFGSTDF